MYCSININIRPAPFQREFAMTKTGIKMETDELIKRKWNGISRPLIK